MALKLTTPYQLDSGGNGLRWYYCLKIDGVISPIGYCLTCGGHDDEDGACEHYREFLIEQKTNSVVFYNQAPCSEPGCTFQTNRAYNVGGVWTVPLCNMHFDPARLRKHVPRPTVMIIP